MSLSLHLQTPTKFSLKRQAPVEGDCSEETSLTVEIISPHLGQCFALLLPCAFETLLAKLLSFGIRNLLYFSDYAMYRYVIAFTQVVKDHKRKLITTTEGGFLIYLSVYMNGKYMNSNGNNQ